MVEVGHKPMVARLATAQGQVRMSETTLQAILAGQGPKGNVVETARLAGIMAAKRTADLIPLCHPLPLSSVTWI
jgi:cyclic pyranopterin phosphate synthase